MRPAIILVALAITAVCGLAVGMSKSVTSYAVQRTWSDSASIYLVYRIRRETVHFSLLDIHGTITGQRDEVKILRKSKESLAGSGTLQFASHNPDTSLLYKDSQFELTERGQGASLATASSRTDLAPCNAAWANTGVVRFSAGIFYCGTIYDFNTRVIARFLPAVATDSGELSSEMPDLAPLNSPMKRLVAIFGENSLVLARVSPVRSSEGLAIQIRSIDGRSAFSKVLFLGNSDTVYMPQYNPLAYSPARFVLRPTRIEDNWILLCTESECQKVTIPWAYSNLIVDERSRNCVFLRQQDLTKPVTQYQVVPF